MTYLTEQTLYPMLINAFGKDQVVRQYRLSNNKRVDYVILNDSRPTAIEFDGYRHFQQNTTIERDLNNQRLLIEEGFRIIHIPYWLQTHFVLPFYFGPNAETMFGYDNKNRYPNGFIDAKCLRPADFSLLGWRRFVYELGMLPTPVREDIRDTFTKLEHTLFEDAVKLYGYGTDEMYSGMNWVDNVLE